MESDTARLQVRAARVARGREFSLWSVPGRKFLTLCDGAIDLDATDVACRLRARLDFAICDGVAVELAVPLDENLRTALPDYQRQAAMLQGHRTSAQSREVSRAGLLHLRALQALDGRLHGASHREIAEALFGGEVVRARWSADGELRAQVRHLLSRGRGFVNGGYLSLAGIRKAASTETDMCGESLPPRFASIS